MGGWADLYRFLNDFLFDTRQVAPVIPTYGRGHNLGGDELPVRFGTEPLVGYRIWLIRDSGSGLGLHSVHVAYEWTAGLQEAECVPGGVNRRSHSGAAPDLNCVCGFYSIHPDAGMDRWDHFIKGAVYAFGQVALSGRIIKCNAGYKAGAAEIVPPVTLEARCEGKMGACLEDPVQILPPIKGDDNYRGQCGEHKDQDGIHISVFLPEAARQLSAKYQVDFLHWT